MSMLSHDPQDRRPVIAFDPETGMQHKVLQHFWPTPVGPGKCLATWQRGTDGSMYAECPHFRYLVKDSTYG